MKDTFILGAGFSKAINEAMPTLQDLSEHILPLVCKQDAAFASRLEDLGANVELWMSYLSQTQPWISEEDTHYNLYMASIIRRHIKSFIDKRTLQTVSLNAPEWLKQIIGTWHARQATVASLNYDTLIERAARDLPLPAATSGIHPSEIYPPFFAHTSSRTGSAIWGKEPLKTFKLLKLHGSMNWYYSGRPDAYGETIFYDDVPPFASGLDNVEKERRARSRDKETLIIPPISEKTTYFRHETISGLWREAAWAIKTARRIFIIGYSLPMSDLGMRLFLSSVRQNPNASLHLIDINNTVFARYRDFLGSRVNDRFVCKRSLAMFSDAYPDSI